MFNTLTVTQLAVGMENKVQMKLKYRKKISAEKMAVIPLAVQRNPKEYRSLSSRRCSVLIIPEIRDSQNVAKLGLGGKPSLLVL